MATPTLPQLIISRLSLQTTQAGRILTAAGWKTDNDQTGQFIGDPAKVLTVRGNIADAALTNHCWLLDIIEALPEHKPSDWDTNELNSQKPTNHEEVMSFLDRRETMSADEAFDLLSKVHTTFIEVLNKLPENRIGITIKASLYGDEPLHELLFDMLTHTDRHFGQAWAIIKAQQ